MLHDAPVSTKKGNLWLLMATATEIANSTVPRTSSLAEFGDGSLT